MNNQQFGHVVQHAFAASKHMKPVAKGKTPGRAFLFGFLFGPIGVGIYLRSWGDFAATLALVLIGSFTTAGVAAPVFWMLSGAWAHARVKHSA